MRQRVNDAARRWIARVSAAGLAAFALWQWAGLAL
jgi:hypothetical protein